MKWIIVYDDMVDFEDEMAEDEISENDDETVQMIK
jgi:hypothetical protein